MNRLTNKDCNKYDDFVFSLRNKLTTSSEINDGIYLKLKSLEDIEEELGMELKVYHKLMNMLYCGKKYPNILYVKDKDNIVQVGILEIDYCKKKIIFYKDKSYNEDYVYAFIQYGKTFALTREELEE